MVMMNTPLSEEDERMLSNRIVRSDGPGTHLYPAAEEQVKNLVYGMIEVVDAFGMSASQTRSVKSLVAQRIFGWFEDVQENSRGAGIGSGWRPVQVEATPDEKMQLRWSGYDAGEGPTDFLLSVRIGPNGYEDIGSIDLHDDKIVVGVKEGSSYPIAVLWAAIAETLAKAPPTFLDHSAVISALEAAEVLTEPRRVD